MIDSLQVPHLTVGDKLLLRAWELSDFSLVQEASQDDYIPLITTVPVVYSPEEADVFVRRQWDRASTGCGYSFVIERIKDGVLLGSAGLWLKELDQGRASLGYWLVNSARGAGTAAETLGAIAQWALSDLRIPRLQLYVEPWNTASIRTAERVGFRREGLLRSWQQVGDARQDMVMYSMLKSDLP